MSAGEAFFVSNPWQERIYFQNIFIYEGNDTIFDYKATMGGIISPTGVDSGRGDNLLRLKSVALYGLVGYIVRYTLLREGGTHAANNHCFSGVIFIRITGMHGAENV